MPSKIKRILIPTILACLFLVASYLSSTGQSITTTAYLPLVSHNQSSWIGPNGGYITSIAIDPSNPQLVYTASWGTGVFKSQDGGQNWLPSNRGLGSLFINSLAIDPIQPATIYAGTYRNQLYKSIDSGNTWVWSGTDMQDQATVYAIAIDPVSPNTVYAATRGISNNGNPPWNGVVYRSVNAGQTWSPVLQDVGGDDVQDWVYSLAVSPFNNNNVYAATHEHGPYHSSTYGDSWHPIHDGINDDSGRAIVISPEYRDSTTIYYGVWHFDTLYKSIDGGNDWFLANHGIAFNKVYNLAIDPLNTDHVYLATFSHGIIKTLDGGLVWQPAGLQDDLIYSISIDPITSSTLYAGTAGDGLQKSLDGGMSWQPSYKGIENAMATSVLVSPSDSKRLFTSIYGAGVYQSTDHGQTWIAMNSGLDDKFVHSLVLDPAQPGVIFALTDSSGLFKVDASSGSDWTKVGLGLPLSQVHLPAYSEGHPFATHEMQEWNSSPESTRLADQAASVNLLVMSFAPSNPQTAYLGTGGSGVYRSDNGGVNWSPAGLGGETIQSLAVDQTDADLVYAATGTPGSLKISLDGGDSWTDASLPVTFYSLATSPTTPGTLYAGTSSGLYTYEAGSWTQLGLADHAVTALAVDPSHSSRIYAGTGDNGAYISKDAGLSWDSVDRNLTAIIVQSIQIDPNFPNYIYFSTKTHGVFLSTRFP
jgi:photosystem II stability/assembly factor-like uncharacterized protein